MNEGTPDGPARAGSISANPDVGGLRGECGDRLGAGTEQPRVHLVARGDDAFVDRIPGRKEGVAPRLLEALEHGDLRVAARHVEMLVAAEHVIDLVPGDVRG